MNKKIIFSIVTLLFLVFFSFNASASSIPSTSPCRVIGSVNIGGSAAPNGLTVNAVPSVSSQKSTTTSGGNYNLNAIGATDGETVTLYLCGISTGITFNFIPYCNSSATEPWLVKNIDFSKQDNGPLPIGGCTCDSVCTGGYCVNPGSDGVCSSTADYYCNNDGTCDSSNYGETASNCPNDCSSPSSSGSGGVGTQDNIEASASEFFGTITSGDTVTVLVNNPDIAVNSLNFTADNDLSSVTFKISELTSQPAGTGSALGAGSGAGSGEVYQFFSVDKKNMVNSDMSSATMDFRVPLSWFAQHSISQDNIALYRFNTATQKWDEIVAVKTSSDSNYVYYTSSVPGFSYFAIGEKGLGATATLGKYTAFQILDIIKAFYEGSSKYSAFEIIDMIKVFYEG